MCEYVLYMVENVDDGACYIGKTGRPLRKRLQQHLYGDMTHFDRSFHRGGNYRFFALWARNEYLMDIGEKALICRRNELGAKLSNSLIYFNMPEEFSWEDADYIYDELVNLDVTDEYSDLLIKKHGSRWD